MSDRRISQHLGHSECHEAVMRRLARSALGYIAYRLCVRGGRNLGRCDDLQISSYAWVARSPHVATPSEEPRRPIAEGRHRSMVRSETSLAAKGDCGQRLHWPAAMRLTLHLLLRHECQSQPE